jgi:hypothetical protein
MKQRHLKIKLDDFLSALTFGMNGVDGGWFLDRDSGEVILAGDGAEVSLKDLAGKPRYVPIHQIDSRSEFRLMEAFVASIDDAPAADRLARSLRERKPFRAFKDALVEFPALRTGWSAFEQAAQRRDADHWCAANGIVVEWT